LLTIIVETDIVDTVIAMPRPTPSNPARSRPTELSPLAREIGKQRPFESPEQEAFLNLFRTMSILEAPFEALFKRHGLSGATYNVLRILRGAGASGLACHQIGGRMIARVPDVTRLVDRLEHSGLALRERSSDDRRIVTVAITPAGLELLAGLDAPTAALHRDNLGHLNRAELDELNRLLVKARAARSGGQSDDPSPRGTP
jgi:DNA-binding MarR family transcriptional regulator